METNSITWASVYAEWKWATTKLGLSLDDVVFNCDLFHPKIKPGTTDLEIVEAGELAQFAEEMQLAFLGRGGIPGTHKFSNGCFSTIKKLVDELAARRHENAAALLLCASLRSRHDGSLLSEENNWPTEFARDLWRLAQGHLQGNGLDGSFWSAERSAGLPGLYGKAGPGAGLLWHPSDQQPTKLLDFVGLLAREHVGCFMQYRPLQIRYVSYTPSHFHAKWFQDDLKKDADQCDWRILDILSSKQHQAAERELDARHPRWREWKGLSRDKLQCAVWMKPRTQLAVDFNVSDVAIAKRCKALNIPMPRAGFWSQVAAGKIPHPDGAPR